MDLTCLGIILVDMFPIEIGKPLVEVSSFTPKPGGAPANVAVAAQRMGSSVAFIGKVGDDFFGSWLRDILINEGINTSGLVIDRDARTSLVFIGMPDKNNAEFVFYRNPGADMLLNENDLNEDLLLKSKALHIDSLSLTHSNYRKATLKAIEIVKNAGGFISYDVNYRPTMWNSPDEAIQAALEIIPLCDAIKINEFELELITGQKNAEFGGKSIIKQGVDLCLITLGENGAFYVTKNRAGFVPAYKVNTIDSIGCGDAFLGAILHHLTQYDSLQEDFPEDQIEHIVDFSSAAGALTSTKRGALPAIPSRLEVENFIESYKKTKNI